MAFPGPVKNTISSRSSASNSLGVHPEGVAGDYGSGRQQAYVYRHGRILAGMDDLLDALRGLRPLWLPLLALSLAAGAGLVLIAWG
jgi:hypothetical protein